MAPNIPPEVIGKEIPLEDSTSPLGDEVVISGISGLFPNCASVVDLKDNLYNKIDMVDEVSYSNITHPNLPRHQGRVKELNKFDAHFFRTTYWQAQTMDPMARKLMECAFAAIYDSGINPVSLAGSKLGVFVGASFTDNSTMNLYDSLNQNAFIISGCSKTMLANRISYWIDGKGPSYGLDQACASSMACLEIAYNSIKRGDCESALVGGCNLCLHPLLGLNMRSAGLLCMDGKTKCFDKNGDGYVRSEAVNVLYLQKAKDAKRIYTEICHIKYKYFMRPDANFLPIRKTEDLEQFLKEFYLEVKISPSAVEYVEAFGSGIAEADGNELNAIGNFFAKSRSVKVGSVKSNMGHTESANGICATTKMCLAYQRGELPPNLHYNEPQDHISAVRDGRIQVVTENTPFTRGYTAINSYSYTGANYHVLLKGHYKMKDINRYKSSIPRLILLSGREENGMNNMMDILTKQPVDPEQIALLHNIYKQNIAGHTGRGYIVLDTNENNQPVSLARSFEFHSGTKRPVCFLYSGMGSQWCGMGTQLMRIPIFANVIERCRKVLEPLGVDIIKILTDLDKKSVDNILNNMVGIIAVQIGLTDILTAIGIIPDYIIGHSIGELGCAYADGCLNAEEILLSSYSRGLVSLKTPFIKGAMAAVGLGYNEILPLCPPEIEVACHNSSESATISGPADVMAQFVSELTSRGIFAKEVPCSNIAYHSRYVAKAGPELKSLMQNFLKTPKLRSKKWISTSVLKENWNEDAAKYASAEYFTSNLLSPVYFEENASLIPKDAIIIEIAPHGLLQAIVKRSHKDCINVPLAKRGSSDSVTFFLEALGKLYLNGLNSSIDVLYPKVEFPVSTETSILSHLIEWDHNMDWPETLHTRKEAKESSARNFVISIHDDDYKFIKSHIRNGNIEFPESALLVLVWETFGMYKGKCYKEMSVTFKDITFHDQIKFYTEDVTRLRLMIHQGTNRFEFTNGNVLIVTGLITDGVDFQDGDTTDSTSKFDIDLNANDIYALLCMRGYSYKGDFRSIHSLCANNEGLVKWSGEWAPFLDALLQINVLSNDHDGVSLPKLIQNLSINVDEHTKRLTTAPGGLHCYETKILKSNAAVRCGGVMLEGVSFEDLPKLEQQPSALMSQEFVPHISTEYVNFETAVSVNLQIVADNVIGSDKINVVEVVTSSSESISKYIQKIADKTPGNGFDIRSIEINQRNIHSQNLSEAKLIVVHDLFANKKNLNILKPILQNQTFVLTLEQANGINKNDVLDMDIITMIKTHIGLFVLVKTNNEHDNENVLYMPINQDSQFSWWPRVQSELQKTRKVVLVSERQPYCGLFEFVKQLKNSGRKIGLVVLNDWHPSTFSPDNDIYKDQLQKNLTFNVLTKGQWGSYYYVSKSQSFNVSNVSLTSNTFEDLDNFTWTEMPASSKDSLIKISYAGPSIRDCQRALGNVKDKTTSFGMDFSGIDNQGRPVMGMVASGAMGTTVEADSSLLWPVPQFWSLEDAATVPEPYIHAYYSLVIKGNLQKNQTVLVTDGSGALGQASISICLNFDCTVFTTVEDENRRRLLLKLFPQLEEKRIILTHQDSFYAPLINLTENKKCDVVLNSYSGLQRKASMKCVRCMGTYLDVSDVDMIANKPFGMWFLQECSSYVTVNLSSLFRQENYRQRKELQKMVAEGIVNGTVRPLSRVVYTPLEVSRAFRLVSSDRNRGRALIKMDFTEAVKVVPRISFSNGAYVVVCDRTNVGVELIDHLVRNGVKKVIVNVKHDYNTNYLKVKSTTWKKNGVKIYFNYEDLQTIQGCENLLKAGQKLDNIDGIFIVQDYKDENGNENIEQSDLKMVFKETVFVVNNLDVTSRKMCSEISYFVYIAVATPNIGSKYAMSACARICETRKNIGLPALLLSCEVPEYEIHREHDDLLSKLELPTVSALFNAMEVSLKQKTSNVFMLNLPEQSSSNYVQKKLEAIIGVRNIEDVDENKMISEICTMNEERIEEIKRALSLTMNTDLSEDLDKMLVGSLKKMCKSYDRRDTNFNKGLGAFYNYMEQNEYVASDAVIPMNTYLTSFEELGFLNRTEPHVLMIPGFEGHHHVFNFLAERIKIRATTLQLGPDLKSQNITEIATILSTLIKTNFEMSSKFYILGYSFGVNVALEVAKILEAEGKTGVIYCLDCSPDALKVQLDAYAGHLINENLENNILEHIYRLISRHEDSELKQDLKNLDSWSEKLNTCVAKLRKQVHFSNEHIKNMLQSAYDRIKLAKEYEPQMKLQSEVVLIRGIPHPNAKNLPDDYNLSKYTTKPVRVFNIESDHVLAPYDGRVSNIVNRMLDSKILEEFKTRNLCDIYYREI